MANTQLMHARSQPHKATDRFLYRLISKVQLSNIIRFTAEVFRSEADQTKFLNHGNEHKDEGSNPRYECLELTTAAWCNGVDPSELCAFTLAPTLNSITTQPSLPRRAITCKGVSPSLFCASMSAPRLTSSSTPCGYSNEEWSLSLVYSSIMLFVSELYRYLSKIRKYLF